MSYVSNNLELKERIEGRIQSFVDAIAKDAGTVFNKQWWTSKALHWCMANEKFKVQLFRFIDVLPYLSSDTSLINHAREYFDDDQNQGIPSLLKLGARYANIGGGITQSVVASLIRSNIKKMATQFLSPMLSLRIIHDSRITKTNFIACRGKAWLSLNQERIMSQRKKARMQTTMPDIR